LDSRKVSVYPINFTLLNYILLLSSHTYAPLSDSHLVAAAIRYGAAILVLVDLGSSTWRELPYELPDIKLDAMTRISDTSVILSASGYNTPVALYRLDTKSPTGLTSLREATNEAFDVSLFSKAVFVSIPTKRSPKRNIYGFIWRPHNPKFRAPERTLPPLIINVHGGPTSYTHPGLSLRAQYYTSRGYAYGVLNYTGSTGHGRDYRESLFGNWGIIDADDVAEFAEYVVETGWARPGAIGITGGSAGGYLTLESLVRYPKVFAAGVSLYGISDVKRLSVTTHKLEAKYVDALVFRPGMTEEEKEAIFTQRSPLNHVDKIRAPLLMLHGTSDEAVPIEQARTMKAAIEKRAGVVRLVEYEGEGHGFKEPKNISSSLEEEEKWWQQTLLSEGNKQEHLTTSRS
jgi:dipeptidyl aminopeptidase/acylaminoacyl peptidase